MSINKGKLANFNIRNLKAHYEIIPRKVARKDDDQSASPLRSCFLFYNLQVEIFFDQFSNSKPFILLKCFSLFVTKTIFCESGPGSNLESP